MLDDIRITVFTPIYNRRHTIHRAFESLMKQTYKSFEWLIVDDGSTDNVAELIEEYKKAADFPIRYYYKKNGGKHTAINMAYTLTDSEFFIMLDSDDALFDNAIERMIFWWDSIPEENKKKYWCVVGLDADSADMSVIGDRFPDGINEGENPSALARCVSGDKFGCMLTETVKKFPFPEVEGTTFITEEIIWNKIEKEYRQYYVNELFCIVYRNEPDSLTASWYKNHVQEGYVSNFFWKSEKLNDVGVTDKMILFQVPYYGYMAKRKTSEILKSVNSKKYKAVIFLLLLPARLMTYVRGRKYIKQSPKE